HSAWYVEDPILIQLSASPPISFFTVAGVPAASTCGGIFVWGTTTLPAAISDSSPISVFSRIVAFIPMIAPRRMTQPSIIAVGAMNACGEILGLRPLYSMIIEATSAEVVSSYWMADAKSIPQAKGRDSRRDDAVADCERSRRARRRRVQHVDRVADLPDDEIVEQRAVRCDRLRADARAA